MCDDRLLAKFMTIMTENMDRPSILTPDRLLGVQAGLMYATTCFSFSFNGEFQVELLDKTTAAVMRSTTALKAGKDPINPVLVDIRTLGQLRDVVAALITHCSEATRIGVGQAIDEDDEAGDAGYVNWPFRIESAWIDKSGRVVEVANDVMAPDGCDLVLKIG